MKSSRALAAVLSCLLALIVNGVQPAASAQRFSDVPANSTFVTEIAWLARTGISTGYADGTFRPAAPVLREQMAAFLYRLETDRLGGVAPTVDVPSTSPFADVPPTHAFYEPILWLSTTGISTGYTEPDGRVTFRPSAPVLREQMAAFLYRLKVEQTGSTPTSGAAVFSDVATTHAFATHISWLAGTGVSRGYPQVDGTTRFEPTAPVLREQMAAFMYRFASSSLTRVEGDGWVTIATAASHACGVKDDGSAWCWGDNSRGALGTGSTVSSAKPVRVEGASDWVAVVVGETHTCGIRVDRSVWCWGANSYATVGDGTLTDRRHPTLVATGEWNSVSAGRAHTCAVRADSTLWCWGTSDWNQVAAGGGSTTPIQLSDHWDWSSVSAGSTHTCGTSADGRVYCWGYNLNYQTGAGGDLGFPSEVKPLTQATAVSVGGSHSCGLESDGTAWCWGANHQGEAGVGSIESGIQGAQYARKVVKGSWSSITAASGFTCGLDSAGSAFCWGGLVTPTGTPTPLDPQRRWVALSAGQSRVCGVDSDGGAWCLGRPLALP